MTNLSPETKICPICTVNPLQPGEEECAGCRDGFGLKEAPDGGVAFPSSSAISRCGPGLSKRELFAALAMQGLAPAYASGGDFMETHVAEGALKFADALLKELAK